MKEYKDELFKLYIEYPFYKLEDVQKIINSKYNLKLKTSDIRTMLQNITFLLV